MQFRSHWKWSLVCWLFASALCAPLPGNAQNASGGASVSSELSPVLQTLGELQQSILSRQQEIDALAMERRQAKTDEERLNIDSRMQAARARLETLQKNVEELLSGMSAITPQDTEEKVTWKEELENIFAPMLAEVREFTERPRAIEALRTRLQKIDESLRRLRTAKERIEIIGGAVSDPSLQERVSAVRLNFEEQIQELVNEQSVVSLRLQALMQEDDSFFTSVREVVQEFLKHRGRNLLLAIVIPLLVFVVLRFIQIKLQNTTLGRRWTQRFVSLRLIGVLVTLSIFLVALFSGLLVLYLNNDWFLLSLAVLILFGLLWTMKQHLPAYWEQTKLLLNIGSVREGERIVINGLPWLVRRINYYSDMVNPALTGGQIRVRLDELAGMTSRPFDKNEPWFSCQAGDWVLLNDTTYGKVELQTPEMVRLRVFGSEKILAAAAFLEAQPCNLSTGFGFSLTFGVDYEHQAAITTEIPEKMEEALAAHFADNGLTVEVQRLSVEFKEAGASSLDLAIVAVFSGRLADQFFHIRRLLMQGAVDACNANGWIIPFTQITLHGAEALVACDAHKNRQTAERDISSA